MINEDSTDFDEYFTKISSYIVDTLHGVPLEMTEDEKEQFRIQVISNQYAERLLSEAEKTEKYKGLSKIDILRKVSIPQLARTIPLKGLNLSLEKYRMPDGVIIERILEKIEESILPATAPRTFVNSHNRDQEPIPALRLHRFGDIFSPSCYNIVDFFLFVLCYYQHLK